MGAVLTLAHEVKVAGARELGERGRTPGQFQALRVLARCPGSTQQRLAEDLGVTKGNVSQLLARLETDGLVAREADGAAYVLRLTPAGERQLAELEPAHQAFMTAWCAPLSDAELGQLERLLARLRRC